MPTKGETITSIIEKLFKTKIDERGRIYVPRLVREEFSIKLGENLYIQVEDNHFCIYTAKAINGLRLIRNNVGEEHGLQKP